MSVPDWRTSTAGTRVRVALWLHSEIGEGGSFTKADLRNAFPNVEQVDRRMRDLRPEGWVIATYREDRSLASDELRLVHEGGRVWERGYASAQSQLPTEKERRATFAADDFSCAYCGVGAGDQYPDDRTRTAQLTVARVSQDNRSLITCCDRCHAGREREEGDPTFEADLSGLDVDERAKLQSWIRSGERDWSRVEVLWSRYRRLPAAIREEIRRTLN